MLEIKNYRSLKSSLNEKNETIYNVSMTKT